MKFANLSLLLLALPASVLLAKEIPLPATGCTGFATSYDAVTRLTTWTASSSLTCGNTSTSQFLSVEEEGDGLIIDVGAYDVVFVGVGFSIGSIDAVRVPGARNLCSRNSLEIVGDANVGSVTFDGSGNGLTALTLNGDGANAEIAVPAFLEQWDSGARFESPFCCRLTFLSDAVFIGMENIGLFGREGGTWEVRGRAAFHDTPLSALQYSTLDFRPNSFDSCVELGTDVAIPGPNIEFELCADAIYAPTQAPTTPPPTVNCAALGWEGSCGAFTDAESCNCWTLSSFACSWSGSSCGTGSGDIISPTPTPPPITPAPPVTAPIDVNCAGLGWAGSCGAFTDAASCNCWTLSSFACSWSGSSCGTGSGDIISPTPTPPPVTAVDCPSLGWEGSCGAFTDEASCECWALSDFACAWSSSEQQCS